MLEGLTNRGRLVLIAENRLNDARTRVLSNLDGDLGKTLTVLHLWESFHRFWESKQSLKSEVDDREISYLFGRVVETYYPDVDKDALIGNLWNFSKWQKNLAVEQFFPEQKNEESWL